ITAIAAARREKREADLAYLLTRLACWQARTEACGEAERAGLEALQLAHRLELAGLEGAAHYALGLAYEGQRRRDQARQHLDLAIAAAQALHDPVALLMAQFALGRLTSEHGVRREAVRRLEQLLVGWSEADRAAFLSIDERASVLAGDGRDSTDLARLRKLSDLLATVARSGGLDDVMADGLKAFVELAGADRGFLLLYDGFEVVERVAYGEGAVANERYSTTLAQQVLFSGEPAVVEDTRAHANLDDQASIQALALRSALAVPLLIDREVIGVMMADSQFTASGWSASDVEMAMALAHAVAIAVSRARRQLADAAELIELELIERLALECVGLPSLAEIATRALNAGLELVGGYDACFLVETAKGMHTVASVGSPAVSSSVYRWVLDNGAPLHLVDAQTDEAFAAAASIMALGLRTIHAAPVAYAGQVLGALYFESTRLEESETATLSILSRLGTLMGAFVARKGVG
ncbi:MAG: multi-sensor signal transduction histidine kinase, partial [Cyanobacteria bacterium RYN_339]|nr:multi-sensor signal transduction histidine kinase [Cyanobacteria bacterium RYN_339]